MSREIFELIDAGDFDRALNDCSLALKRDPEKMAYLEALAYWFMKREGHAVAYHLLKYVYSKLGPLPETLNNLGMNAMSLASSSGDDKYLNEAEQLIRKGIGRLKSSHSATTHASLYENLALISLNSGEIKDGEKFALEAIKHNPQSWGALETLAYAQLSQANWAEGFVNYEYALGSKYRKPKPANNEPYWQGQEGTIYLRAEQGIGDVISYASVLPDAMKHNTITLECDERLGGLFKRSFPDLEIHATRFQKNPAWLEGRTFDYHALIGSLCAYYRKKDEDFPRTAFLKTDPERVLQWKALLDTLPGKKVGIAWTGGLLNTFQRRRSHSLEAWLPILKTPGITWVSLEYKDRTEEIEAFEKKHGIKIHVWPRATINCDYDETAALIQNLECVVSTTTATVHLCGAIGKECHVIVPKKTRWFYQSTDQKHRWYDSLILYRQADKWPIERIAQVLRAKAPGTGEEKRPYYLPDPTATEQRALAESLA